MRIRLLSLQLSLVCALLAAPGQAQNFGDAEPLVDEPSRADLFERIIEEAEAEHPLTPEEQQEQAVRGAFRFPDDVGVDAITGDPRPPAVFGIDLSHHQGSDIDFSKMHQHGVRFAFIKASQGKTYFDSRFNSNWKALGALDPAVKLYRGAYHFLSAGVDCKAQAKNFIGVVNASGKIQPDDLPPVVDMEWDVRTKAGNDYWAFQKPSAIVDCALDYLKAVEAATGKKPIIYTAASWWRERIGDDQYAKFDDYRLWIADYSKSSRGTENPRVPAKKDWQIWQFTDASTVKAGFAGKLDASIFHGDEVAFKTAFDLPN